MKHLELSLNKRLLIVEAISKGVADAWVFNSYGLKTMMNSVCEGSRFTEEKARLYVELTNRIYSPKGWEFWFIDYTDDTKHKTSAVESFISAIESKGYHWRENPVKYPDKNNPKYYDEPFDGKGFYQEIYSSDIVDWKKAESRTFNPEKTLMFEIL